MYPLWEYFEFKTFCDIKYTYLIICEFLCFLYTCSLIYVALWYCWSYSVFCAKILLPIFIYLQYVLVNNSQKIISSSNPSSSNLLIGFFYFPKWFQSFYFAYSKYRTYCTVQCIIHYFIKMLILNNIFFIKFHCKYSVFCHWLLTKPSTCLLTCLAVENFMH